MKMEVKVSSSFLETYEEKEKMQWIQKKSVRSLVDLVDRGDLVK